MKSLINIGKVCHNSRKVLSFCQFGRGGGHKKLIFSALQRCYYFLEFLFSRLFSSFRLFTSCDSSCNAVELREAYLVLSSSPLLRPALYRAVCPLGGCGFSRWGFKDIVCLAGCQTNLNVGAGNQPAASCVSSCNAVELREAQFNEHCSSSFLTRFLPLFHTSCNVFGRSWHCLWWLPFLPFFEKNQKI